MHTSEKDFFAIQSIVGRTPYFLYDRKKIEQRVQLLREQLPREINIYYAIKANPFTPLLALMASQVDGFDVSSHQEMLSAINSGIESQHISFAGPGKTRTELLSALMANVVISVESLSQLNELIHLSQLNAIKPKISIRINPDFTLKRSGMMMTGMASPFGLDVQYFPEALEILSSANIPLYGIHIFSGSQNLDAHAIVESQNCIFEWVLKMIDQYQLDLAQLNIGGGFGIPYFAHEKPLDLSLIGQNLRQRIEEKTKHTLFAQTQIIIELGRYLVGEAGYYVSQVIDIKESKGEYFVVVDGGMHHHLANSGNLGQVIRKNYPIRVQKKHNSSATEHKTVNIVGPLCTPLDIVAQKIDLPNLELGDLIIVEQSGAYAKSASPQEFLSHSKALELLL